MKVHFYPGVFPHFVNHLLPLYWGLPEDLRGDWYIRRNTAAERRLKEFGITGRRFQAFRNTDIVAVASFEDYRVSKPASVIFVNHGVGQTYRESNFGSYAGGPQRERCVLMLHPNERAAQMDREVYPDIPSVAVGVPYLDQFSGLNRPVDGPVCFSFHANIHLNPETRWSWPWIKNEVFRISQNPAWPILGHCHPRVVRQLEPWYKRVGISFEPDWWKVLAQARCYVIDNSSSGYEAQALGIPVVWLNPPQYRRNVHHGLRFWEFIPGPQVDDPSQLETAINMALEGTDKPVGDAYGGLVDGHATERAVAAICQTLGYSPLPQTSSMRSAPA